MPPLCRGRQRRVDTSTGAAIPTLLTVVPLLLLLAAAMGYFVHRKGGIPWLRAQLARAAKTGPATSTADIFNGEPMLSASYVAPHPLTELNDAAELAARQGTR